MGPGWARLGPIWECCLGSGLLREKQSKTEHWQLVSVLTKVFQVIVSHVFPNRCIGLDEIGDQSSPEERRETFIEIDVDKSGAVDFEEYLCVCINRRNRNRNQRQYSGHNTPLGHHTDHMGLGQYESLEEYCGLSTASHVFLIFTTQLYKFLLVRFFFCLQYVLTRLKYFFPEYS